MFEQMRLAGIETTEREDGRTFFARARKIVAIKADASDKPCECVY